MSKGLKRTRNYELVTTETGYNEMPFQVFGKNREDALRIARKKLLKGERIISLKRGWGENMGIITVYKDKAGNRLIQEFTHKGDMKIYGVNAEGKLVNPESLRKIISRSGIGTPGTIKKQGEKEILKIKFNRWKIWE